MINGRIHNKNANLNGYSMHLFILILIRYKAEKQISTFSF